MTRHYLKRWYLATGLAAAVALWNVRQRLRTTTRSRARARTRGEPRSQGERRPPACGRDADLSLRHLRKRGVLGRQSQAARGHTRREVRRDGIRPEPKASS